MFNDTFNNVSGITYNMVASFIGINATVNNISAMMYDMAFSFIGVQRHFQHCDKLTNLHVYRYIVGFFFIVPYIYFYSTFKPHQINFKNMNLG